MLLSAALLLALLALLALYLLLRERPGTPTEPSTFPTDTVEVGDWTFRYHRSGRGPTLLLLHGIGANLYCWRTLVSLLAPHFDVVAPDLPGFGQSRGPAAARFGLDDQVPRVLAFLDRLGAGPVFVVGNSMGGNIALWMTKTQPERVRAVAVIAPATSPRLMPLPMASLAWLAVPVSRLLSRRAFAWAHRRTVTRKELVDALRVEETYLTYVGSPEAVRSFLLATEAIRDLRLPRQLTGIRKRVLILWGSRDLLVKRAVIDALESALPEAESEVHLGGGHHLQEDEPDWVAGRLLTFFQD